jgi:hypothetical protein
MDPKANLERQRQIAAGIIALSEHGDDPTEVHDDIRPLAIELAELVQALDQWRRNGGFDPYGG